MNKYWRLRIANIKLALIMVIPTISFLVLPHTVSAEDPGECFMVTSSGRTITLRKLCGEQKISQDRDNRVFKVPIKRRIGRTPVIDVTFNNKTTVEMIVDTGANNTLITMGVANALRLQPTGMMQAQIADGTQVQFSTSKIKSMAAGGAVAKDLEVAIAPKAGIGLLGHDFFDNYDIKILEKEVEFYPR